MKKFFYHKDHDVIYGFNALTAEQVKEGYLTELLLVDEDDPRVQRLLPEHLRLKKPSAKSRKGETLELDESVLETAAEKKE